MPELPYGAWPSNIKAQEVARAGLRLSECVCHAGAVYWLEGRPAERGNIRLVRWQQGVLEECSPSDYNVRSRVHEYGGGSYILGQDSLFFCNFSDQKIYTLPLDDLSSNPKAVSPEGAYRFADLIALPDGGIVAVCEWHSDSGVINQLVMIDPETRTMRVLFADSDFVACPSYHAKSHSLAWLAWDHPNMPWDATRLYCGTLSQQGLQHLHCLVDDGSSLQQCRWGPDDKLYVISDRNNWWNLYRIEQGELQSVIHLEQEMANAPWLLGNRSYDFLPDGRIIFLHNQLGKWSISLFNEQDQSLEELKLDINDASYLFCGDEGFVFCGASGSQATAIEFFDLKKNQIQILRHSSDLEIDSGLISMAQVKRFSQSRPCYGLFYSPQNEAYYANQGEKPPLIVNCHGGPTASSSAAYNPQIQYWTSRGFAVLDLNYSGSTGYGRAYRKRLEKKWGILDVEDCIHAVKELIQQGEVDADRIAISGGSAGGYTVLCALTQSRVFKAGCCRYGIGDLISLLKETHKFESNYLQSLIGVYPEEEQVYRDRSPIFSVKKIQSPVLFIHGEQDAVVPINQAEHMVRALEKQGISVKLIRFAEEQHGFRQAQNIARALESELAFYGKVFQINTKC